MSFHVTPKIFLYQKKLSQLHAITHLTARDPLSILKSLAVLRYVRGYPNYKSRIETLGGVGGGGGSCLLTS